MSSSTSSSEKYIFQCDEHEEYISAKLQKFYEKQVLFDTIVIAGENNIQIRAHRIVLSAMSKYFWKTFHSNPTNSYISEVKLKEIEAPALKLIIDFVYWGTIELSADNVEELLRGAGLLKIKSLINGCCDFLGKHLNKSNCLHSLRLAIEFRSFELQQKSLKIIYNNFEEVRKQSGFLLLKKNEVKYLLFDSNSHDNLEEEVFLGLMDWIEHDQINRSHLLFELLSMVRFQFLTPKFIVKNTISICNIPENCKLILGWLQYHLWPESRTTTAAIGLNEQNELEMYSYEQHLKSWVIRVTTKPLLLKKYGGYSKIVIDDKLFLVGGYISDCKVTKSVECIDLKTFELTELPPMEVARKESQVANLNGDLCVFGGLDDESDNVDWLEIFNFSTRQWTALELPFKIDSMHQQMCSHNDVLYIFDNRRGFLHCYEALTKKWTSKSTSIDHNLHLFNICVVGDLVYIFCGPNSSVSPTTVIKCLNLSKDTWSEECSFNYYTTLSMLVTSVIGNEIWLTNSDGEVIVYNLVTKKITPQEKLESENYLILPYRF